MQLYDFISSTRGDIYLLQETKLDTGMRLALDGFNVFRCDTKRGWGGVAIFVRGTVPVRNVVCSRGPILAVSVECRIGSAWARIGSVYVPHGLADPEGDFRSFFQRHPDTLFGGDFNARNPIYGDSAANRYGISLSNVSLTTPITILNPPTPTCFHAAEGSFIDKFVFSGFCPILSNCTVVPSFSDHMAISVSVPGEPAASGEAPTRKLFHLAHTKSINRTLDRRFEALAIPTESGLTSSDCELVAEQIETAMTRAIAAYVPDDSRPGKRMVLSTTVRALQARCKKVQRKIHRSHGLISHSEMRRLVSEVSQLRTMIGRRVEFEVSEFFSDRFNGVKTHRDACEVIGQFTGHKRKARISSALFTDDTKTSVVSGDANIAHALADRFSANHNLTVNWPSDRDSEARNFADSLVRMDGRIFFAHDVPADIATRRQRDEIDERLPLDQRGLLTSVEEVAQIIRERPNKKSCGSDGVPYCVLKQFDSSLLRWLSIFFNHLISISYFPRSWRNAIVIPIPKPGKDASLVENWRPISQLKCISKVFERVIANRLSVVGSAHERLFPDQFGFLRGHSTEHALSRLQSDVIEGLNCRMATTIVALDLRAAFDTVWHDGLILKMNQIGINPFLIRVVNSMLRERTFSVRLNGCFSPPMSMPAGVPQGSVLAPICFNFFMYDVPRSPRVKNLQFADDTTVYATHDSPGSAQGDLNWHLAKLNAFFRSSKLILNPQKTELLHVLGFQRDTSRALREHTKAMRISVDGHLLPRKESIRLLGVQFQTSGRFTRNVDARIAKATRARYHVSRILKNRCISTRVKVGVYRMYLRPILTYAAPVWCLPPLTSSHQMERMRIFERSCLRSAANIRRARGSYKHVRAGDIYERAKCIRIDRFVAKRHVSFFSSIRDSENPKFKGIIDQGSPGPYPSIFLMQRLFANDRLTPDGKLMLFHRRYDGNGMVYNTQQ